MSRDVLRMMRQVKQNGVDHVVNDSKSADLKVTEYRKTMNRINSVKKGPKVLQKEKAKKVISSSYSGSNPRTRSSGEYSSNTGPSIPIQPISARSTKSLPVKTNQSQNQSYNSMTQSNESKYNGNQQSYNKYIPSQFNQSQFNQAPHNNSFNKSIQDNNNPVANIVPINRTETEEANEVFYMSELNSLKSPHPEQISIERGVHVMTSSDADSDCGSQTGTVSLKKFREKLLDLFILVCFRARFH